MTVALLPRWYVLYSCDPRDPSHEEAHTIAQEDLSIKKNRSRHVRKSNVKV
jgi:hypothetical protein